jgi:hypothetical protein
MKARPLPLELMALARQHLGAEPSIHVAPRIPSLKEANVRAVHEAHLPGSEPVLVLYDATIFGGAENGFVITPERLCWKNLLEHPRQIPWGELDPRSIVAETDRIGVAGGGVDVSGVLCPAVARLLVAMIERHVRADAGPYRSHADRSPAADRLIMRITGLARRHVGELEQVYYHPAIPPLKVRNARAVHAHHLEADEPVAVLYDDTVFGSAKDGFLITPRRLCWKNVVSDPEAAEWRSIAQSTVSASGNLVHVLGSIIQLTARADLAPRVATLLAEIAAAER